MAGKRAQRQRLKAELTKLSRALKGRQIERVEFHVFETGRDADPFTYSPCILLDDGSRLTFDVHETDVGEYGIRLRRR